MLKRSDTTAIERKLDAMRELIASYPNWSKWGILPRWGTWSDTDISVDWFKSATDTPQLSLQMTGSDIIRSGADPVRQQYIEDSKSITRQMNFVLNILQFSGTSGERADTNEFLLDFIEWLDLIDVERKAPIFGDIPQKERTWATNGSFVAEWEGTQPASVYTVQIHKIYTKNYAPINTW